MSRLARFALVVPLLLLPLGVRLQNKQARHLQETQALPVMEQ